MFCHWPETGMCRKVLYYVQVHLATWGDMDTPSFSEGPAPLQPFGTQGTPQPVEPLNFISSGAPTPLPHPL